MLEYKNSKMIKNCFEIGLEDKNSNCLVKKMWRYVSEIIEILSILKQSMTAFLIKGMLFKATRPEYLEKHDQT